MKHLVFRGAIALFVTSLAVLAACTSSPDNGLEGLPPVKISESERIPLTAGAIGTTGLTLTDADSGAEVSIPGGTVITLDASAADDVAAVVPQTIVGLIRPTSASAAQQPRPLLTAAR